VTISKERIGSDISDLDTRRGSYIKYLILLENRNDGPSRAGLAALRTGLRSKDGIAIQMMPHVCRYLGNTEHWTDRWFFAVGSLFALHPLNTSEKLSLGTSFGQLKIQSDSTEKHFQLLISSSADILFERLKQTVSLLKSQSIPINWYILLRHLTMRSWDDPQRRTQLLWARDFYRAAVNS
jgi:CRISPR system Cascade subunit CasB